MQPPRERVLDRFLRYVQVNTQSAEGVTDVPSTPGQWDLARMLATELHALGLPDVRISDSCIVYATVPGTLESPPPVIGFIAHVDTSPAVSGTGVKPVIHRAYAGGDIVLPADPTQVIAASRTPALEPLIGDDIITADGRTLLGSDDKAGVAAIMTMVDVLMQNPDLLHGPVAVAFTSDEEIGIGIDRFDVAGFGAQYAYTVDGDALGEINHETWSARGATVSFNGISAHPGSAKGLMVNSIYAAADFLLALPAGMRPEVTEGREGFIHPYNGLVDTERSVLKVILRDFDDSGLERQQRMVEACARDAAGRWPGVTVDVAFDDQYRNMNDVLRDHPALIEDALEATRRAGLTPHIAPIRGGTDGAKLTFRGLPCPNIFTGGHNFHSKLEFNSARGLEKTTETLVHLVQVAAERHARPE